MSSGKTPEQEADPRLRWLKPLVIGLSAVFVLLLGVFIVAMVSGVPARRAAPVGAGPAAVIPATAFPEAATLALPAGARLLDVLMQGELVLLRLRLADGSEQLITLNARTLAPQAGLRLRPEP